MPTKTALEKEVEELKGLLEKVNVRESDRVNSNQERLEIRAKLNARAQSGNTAKVLNVDSPGLLSRITKTRSQKAGKTTVLLREFREPTFRWGNKPAIISQIDPDMERLHAYEGSYNDDPLGGIEQVTIDESGKGVKADAEELAKGTLLDPTSGDKIGENRAIEQKAKVKAIHDKKPEEKIL